MRNEILVLIVVLIPAISFGDWDIEVPYADTSGKGAAVVVDGNNNPHIVYFVDDDQFYHIYKSDSLWYGPYPIADVNYFTFCRMLDLAMVQDTANAILSLEYTATGDYLLWGKHLGSGIWSTEQIPNTLAPSGAGGYLNVAISPGVVSSLFHIIYVHYNYGSPILYYRKFDSTWTNAEEVTPIPNMSAGWQNDIAVDVNDDPHVAFVFSDEGIKYRRKTSGSWDPIELVSPTTDPSFTSIAVDNSNYPHLAYDKDDYGAVCYRAKTASGWQSEEMVGAGGGWNTYGASIAIAGGEKLVAYYAAGDLKFAMWTASGWVSEDVDTSGDVGTYASLVIDDEGYAHIAYRDATNECLKYAKSTEPVVGILEADGELGVEHRGLTLQVYPNPFHQKTQIRFMIQDSRCMIRKAKVRIYDAAGSLVRSFNPESCILDRVSAISWDGTDQFNRKIGSGVYFLKLKAGDYCVTEKLLLMR